MVKSFERLAFDTRAYTQASVSAVASDLAAVALENSHQAPVWKRIHQGRLGVSLAGEIIDEKTQLRPRYSRINEFDRREANAGDKFDEILLTHPKGTAVFWLSLPEGPLNYQEGRIRVGLREDADGNEPHLTYYGVPVRTELSYQEFGQLAARLSEFSESPVDFSDVERLRDQILIIPGENIDTNLWDFLKQQAPQLSEAWSAIADQRVDNHNGTAFNQALEIAPILHHQIQLAKSSQDFLQIGAQGERFMMAKGHAMTGSGCGRLNSEIVGYSRTEATVQGGVVTVGESRTFKFVKNCGKCGRSINSFICRGYQCGCGGTYLGC